MSFRYRRVNKELISIKAMRQDKNRNFENIVRNWIAKIKIRFV